MPCDLLLYVVLTQDGVLSLGSFHWVLVLGGQLFSLLVPNAHQLLVPRPAVKPVGVP